ncbi:unnamed protein product [Rotaria sordida]|uniref:Uncharacterized protein n=1 Tax=Rotaria sordida TaxID=392033 RepID=A0A818K5A3_9BILA|nr:unnamed protein product [Rotaria sordida]CAF3552730.1 unnamed protein product [Rotaria sordida]
MSNELKYVLLPKIEDRRRTPKFQPWYRERLKMKYPCHMDTKNWKFVKDGLDDFRDGLPPSHDDIILEPEKGPSPIVLSQSRRIKANVSNIRNRLTDRQIYFSRELPTAEKRRQLIDSYISTLLDHPMTFFPHFNQTLPPDAYEKLTKLLETELSRMNNDEQNIFIDECQDIFTSSSEVPIVQEDLNNTERSARSRSSSQSSSQLDDQSEPEELESKRTSTRPGRTTIVYDESGNPWDSEELERKQKNPYRWYIEKQQQKQQSKGPTQDDEATTAMEARLRSVSEQFCNWLYEFGGETNRDIDPAVVRNLFSTAYDTKPSLSVPIKIVEMTRIPPELREGAQETMIPQTQQRKTTFPELHLSSSITKSRQLSTSPSDQLLQSQKYRYGAWYLPKNLWQYSLKTEELQDPKVLQAEREDPARKREEQMNARLAPLHGIDAFKEYLVEKNVRRLPKLITDVEQYRRDNPRDITGSTPELQAKK